MLSGTRLCSSDDAALVTSLKQHIFEPRKSHIARAGTATTFSTHSDNTADLHISTIVNVFFKPILQNDYAVGYYNA